MKKKSSDSKLTSAVSHDVSDGLAGSKLSAGQLPESGVAGNVVMRRAATIAVEDTDFDRVERGSILQDMRAGRVKAPKRRPPSAAINVLGESNNNSVYVNGSGMASSASELSEDGGKQATVSSDDNSTGEEAQLVKPKPRDWEKKKAPWMEELKASQVTRKKTSPSVEPRGGAISVAERTSKLFAAEQTTTATSSVLTTSATSSTSTTSSNTTATTRVQSSAVTSSNIMQQSMIVESSSSSSSSQRKESSSSSSISTNNMTSNNNHNDAIMSKSMSAAKVAVTSSAIAATAASSDEESRVTRPNSLSIRNRSVSPLVKTSNVNSTAPQEKSNNISAHDGTVNNHQASTASAATAAAAATTAESTVPRVQQLENRVDKLESMVLSQQRTIEDLIRTLREETERVKVLRGELDKYAQCVTQV